MARLGLIAQKIRSKNAGPFWLTIDIFCGAGGQYPRINAGLQTSMVAGCFDTNPDLIKRFEIPDLQVIKFSLPRPTIQGDTKDRDMHGASWAVLVEDIEIVA